MIISSCFDDNTIEEGMVPVYVDADDYSLVYSSDTIPFGNLGNINVVGDYLFINEKYKGIHVIDNTDPSNPKQIFFWNIPGNSEFTIDGNILYADNSISLLVIDISDFSNIKVISVVEDWYLDTDEDNPVPPDYIGPFECIDNSKGIVVGWQLEMIENPKCYTY